jgi:hypothetical protein
MSDDPVAVEESFTFSMEESTSSAASDVQAGKLSGATTKGIKRKGISADDVDDVGSIASATTATGGGGSSISSAITAYTAGARKCPCCGNDCVGNNKHCLVHRSAQESAHYSVWGKQKKTKKGKDGKSEFVPLVPDGEQETEEQKAYLDIFGGRVLPNGTVSKGDADKAIQVLCDIVDQNPELKEGRKIKGQKKKNPVLATYIHKEGFRKLKRDKTAMPKMDQQVFVNRMRQNRAWTPDVALAEWNKLDADPKNIADYKGPYWSKKRLYIPGWLIGDVDAQEDNIEHYEEKELEHQKKLKADDEVLKKQVRDELNKGFKEIADVIDVDGSHEPLAKHAATSMEVLEPSTLTKTIVESAKDIQGEEPEDASGTKTSEKKKGDDDIEMAGAGNKDLVDIIHVRNVAALQIEADIKKIDDKLKKEIIAGRKNLEKVPIEELED